MTVLAAVCTKMPEAKLAIIFLPMFTFTAGNVCQPLPINTPHNVPPPHPLASPWLVLLYPLTGAEGHRCHGCSRCGSRLEVL